jgi:nitrite reductase/ring-hydroxylating ferredoxin subunit
MKDFMKICRISDLEEFKGQKFQLDSETEIAIFKIKEKIYAVDNICPHNHTPKIFKGFIKNNFVICPVHLYEFNLSNGKPKNNLGGNLRIFETKIEDDCLYVKPSKEKKFNFDF